MRRGHDDQWMADAACANGASDPEEFFPPSEENKIHRHYPAIGEFCNNCPVRGECLTYALVFDIKHGIWGGLTARQRGTLRNQARRDRLAAKAG